jgi:hypothetical protein
MDGWQKFYSYIVDLASPRILFVKDQVEDAIYCKENDGRGAEFMAGVAA